MLDDCREGRGRWEGESFESHPGEGARMTFLQGGPKSEI